VRDTAAAPAPTVTTLGRPLCSTVAWPSVAMLCALASASGQPARETTLALNSGAPVDLVLVRTGAVARIRFIDQTSGLPIAKARGLLSRQRIPLAALATDANGVAEIPAVEVTGPVR